MTILLFNLVNEASMYRLLAVATAAAALCLIAICASSNRPIWVTLPLYVLMLSCSITCSTTFWMRSYTISWCIITIFVLAIATLASAIDGIVKPMAQNVRASIVRRSLTWGLPLFFFFLISWIASAKLEYGVGFFDRIDQKIDRTLVNQDSMKGQMSDMKTQLEAIKADRKRESEITKTYRDGADKKFEDIIEGQSAASIRLHRLETDKQKAR